MSVLPPSYTPRAKQILKREHRDDFNTIWLALREKQGWIQTQRNDYGATWGLQVASWRQQQSWVLKDNKEAQKSPALLFLSVKTKVTRPLLVFLLIKLHQKKPHPHVYISLFMACGCLLLKWQEIQLWQKPDGTQRIFYYQFIQKVCQILIPSQSFRQNTRQEVLKF